MVIMQVPALFCICIPDRHGCDVSHIPFRFVMGNDPQFLSRTSGDYR